MIVIEDARRHCDPVERSQLVDLVRRLVPIHPHIRVEAQMPDFWESYARALGDLPLRAVQVAVLEWERVGKWFPKPAELRELAMPTTLQMRARLQRMERAVREQPKGPALPAPRVTKEQFDELKRAMGLKISD